MKLEFKKLNEYYNKASGLYNKIIIILLVLVVGLAVMSMVNPPYSGYVTKDITSQVESKFIPCPQTAETKLEASTSISFNTLTQISLINYSSEVLSGDSLQTIIPPINNPSFVNKSELNDCLTDDRNVVVVTLNDITKIYPQAILENHIVINDKFGDTPIIIVHTPISGLFKAYKSKIKNETYIFGHSGLLYKNTDLLIDYKTNTLWSAFDGKALVGMQTGAVLEKVDVKVMDYGKAKKEYSDSMIMSFVTGYRRYYGIDPFVEFKSNNVIFQEPKYKSAQLENKEYVLGFEIEGLHYAIPISKVTRSQPYKTKIDDNDVKLVNDEGEYILYYGKNPSKQIKFDKAFWYIWYEYFPDTRVI